MSADGFGGAMASLAAYEILPEQGLVIVPYAGPFHLGWWRALMDAVLEDVRYRPGMSFLVDRRRARSAPTRPDVEGRSEYARRHGDALRGGRWAVVTVSEAEGEMARLLGWMGGTHHTVPVRPFAEEGAAMDWALAAPTAAL